LTPSKKSITIEAITKLFFEKVWVHFGFHGPLFQIGIEGF
jgi:hypothetical protein